MEYEKKIGIALVVGFILLVRGYIRLFSKNKSWKEKIMEKAKIRGDFTTARCVKTTIRRESYDASESDFLRNRLYIVKYEYEVEGKKYYKTLTYQNPGSVSCQYPVEITIYYDSKRPGKGYCINEIDEGTKKSFGCFSSIIFAFFVMWLIINIL